MENRYAAYDWQPHTDAENGHLAIQEKFSASFGERVFFLLFGFVSHEVVMAQTSETMVEIHSEIHLCMPKWLPHWVRALMHPRIRTIKLEITNIHSPQTGVLVNGLSQEKPL